MLKECSKCSFKGPTKFFGCYNVCKKCKSKYNKIYGQIHKKEIRKNNKKYYKNNINKILKTKKIYRKKNKNEIKRKRKLHYKRHRIEILKSKRIYTKKHKKEKNKYNKKYYENNKSRILSHQKKYYNKTSNKQIKYSKKYYKNHKNNVKIYHKNYNKKHKKERRRYNKEYRKKNKNKLIKSSRKRRAWKAKVKENYTIIDEAYTLNLFKYRCFNCKTKKNLQIDHIYPLSKGYSLTRKNAAVLCRQCNASKKDKWPEEFYSPNKFKKLKKLIGIKRKPKKH